MPIWIAETQSAHIEHNFSTIEGYLRKVNRMFNRHQRTHPCN